MPLADSSLWWMGIRSILFVLLSPRNARRLCNTEVPSTYLPALRRIAGNPRLDFQQHSLASRLDVLRFVVWLLDSWPARFVAVMRQSGIGASDFLLQESYVPYWLAQVCRTELNGKRYQVSPAEVAAAADALSSSVERPSKIAVKRLLGVTEGKALDALMPKARPPLSTAEVESVMRLMDSDIRTLPSAWNTSSRWVGDCAAVACRHQGRHAIGTVFRSNYRVVRQMGGSVCRYRSPPLLQVRYGVRCLLSDSVWRQISGHDASRANRKSSRASGHRRSLTRSSTPAP